MRRHPDLKLECRVATCQGNVAAVDLLPRSASPRLGLDRSQGCATSLRGLRRAGHLKFAGVDEPDDLAAPLPGV
jgi:hypothetical protein